VLITFGTSYLLLFLFYVRVYVLVNNVLSN